jgi:RNA polymerase sigma-70 factor (ECF subfamily)
MSAMTVDAARVDGFTEFFRVVEPRLRRGLVAAHGLQRGQEAAAAAMEYAWEQWDRVGGMENPAGYLYRVGCHAAARAHRHAVVFPEVDEERWPWVEPGLPRALGRLSEQQRVVVVLRHCFEWSQAEVAALLGISRGSVQEHEERGLGKLRRALGVGR